MAELAELEQMQLPPYPVHPGPWLQEELDARGLTLEWLSTRTGRPLHELREVVEERALYDEAMAAALEQTLGIDARFWTNGVEIYRLTLQRDRLRSASNDALTAAD